MLSVPERTYRAWTKDKKDEQKKQRDKKIFDLWLACYTQEEIAEKIGIDQATISRTIEDMQNGQMAEMHKPPDFEPQLYDVWSIGKATNEVSHPGNIPPEIIENLLYYYTNPF